MARRFAGKDRTYTADDRELQSNFVLAKENGEWRIDNPPPGLLVARVSPSTPSTSPTISTSWGTDSSLVPDPIYLPALSNPANVASALMKALLNGPSKWLKPAVSTAIPPNTRLSVDSVTITDGIAEVRSVIRCWLCRIRSAACWPPRSLYTLKQVGGVKGVVIKVNQQPYRVPGAIRTAR